MKGNFSHKYLMLVFLMLISCNIFATPIQVKYSESVDIFNFIDHLSLWDAELPTQYFDFWKKNQATAQTTANDQKILKEYAKVRIKYSKNIPPSIFPHGKKEDPIAEIFYYSEGFEEAYSKLAKQIHPKDLAVIKKTIDHFNPKVKKIIKSYQAPNNIVKYFDDFLKEEHVIQYINKICMFYSVDPKMINATIFIVWWPNQKFDQALSIDKSIFIYSALDNSDPSIFSDKKISLSSVVMHELTHHISKLRTASTKNSLASTADSYAKKLKLSPQNYLYLMEEPLAVILGQMLYLEKHHSDYYNYTDDWYANPLINALARLNKPLVNEYFSANRPIDHDFIKAYFSLITEMIAATDVALTKT